MLKRVNGNGTLEQFCDLQCKRNCCASEGRRIRTSEGPVLAYLPGRPPRAPFYYAVVRSEAHANFWRLCSGEPTGGHRLLCGGAIGGLCELPEALCWQACSVDHRGLHSTMRWFDRRPMRTSGGSVLANLPGATVYYAVER